jgi:hypothetical protein
MQDTGKLSTKPDPFHIKVQASGSIRGKRLLLRQIPERQQASPLGAVPKRLTDPTLSRIQDLRSLLLQELQAGGRARAESD